MRESIWKSLCAALDAGGEGVLASVVHCRGATPRKPGALMWIEVDRSRGSVGGGAAEANVLTEARTLLCRKGATACLELSLQGGEGAFGVCGGHMQVALRRWQGSADAALAREFLAALQCMAEITVPAEYLGHVAISLTLEADPRLLIVGGGHCGLALARHAVSLDFDVWAYDPRDEWLQAMPAACRALHGDWTSLGEALRTSRPVYAVLLNRDYAADACTLEQLARQPPGFIGMMGSARRIHEVRHALSESALAALSIHAPVGLEIAAETPDEIAISVLAQLVQHRRTTPAQKCRLAHQRQGTSVDDPK